MKRENEEYLWNRLRFADEEFVPPRDVIDEMLDKDMIQSPKQAWRTLEKWCKKGIYEYGVCLDLGWKV
jgi:hypothetical protein